MHNSYQTSSWSGKPFRIARRVTTNRAQVIKSKRPFCNVQGGPSSVRFGRFVRGTVRAVPVFGSNGSSSSFGCWKKRFRRSAVPKRGCSKRGPKQKHSNARKRSQMRVKERKRKSAKSRKGAKGRRKGAKERFRVKNGKQPGLKQLGLGTPKMAPVSSSLVAPYRAILRYYRCDAPYRAILFQGG